MHHGGIHRVNVDSVGEHHDIRPVYGVDDLVGPAPVTIATRVGAVDRIGRDDRDAQRLDRWGALACPRVTMA
jgi:hypothetical protein